MLSLLQIEYWGNPVQGWFTALAVAVALLTLLRLLKWGLLRYATRRRPDGEEGWDVFEVVATMARATPLPFIVIFAAYAGLQALDLPPGLTPWILSIAMSSLILQATFWATSLVDYFLVRSRERRRDDNTGRLTTLRTAAFISKLALAVIAAVLILDNIPGVEITALVASLGITGIAVALAVQNILSDLFASLSIVLDRPFVIGDFIIVDDCLGTVEHIGLKTTRVRSLSGEQLVFANNDLLKSRVRNYRRMAERRVVFAFGVTYQTLPEKLKRIPATLRRIIESQDATRFDRAHFKGYGSFALDFEVVYYVQSPDYNRYMDIQQAINLALFEALQEEGIEFAYPTQTLFLDGARPRRFPPSLERGAN